MLAEMPNWAEMLSLHTSRREHVQSIPYIQIHSFSNDFRVHTLASFFIYLTLSVFQDVSFFEDQHWPLFSLFTLV
jgi:hypothetical protein